MINLAMLKNNAIWIFAIIALFLIGYNINAVKGIFFPNTDKEIARTAEARLAQLNMVLDINKKLKADIARLSDSKVIDDNVTVSLTKDVKEMDKTVAAIIKDLQEKHLRAETKNVEEVNANDTEVVEEIIYEDLESNSDGGLLSVSSSTEVVKTETVIHMEEVSPGITVPIVKSYSKRVKRVRKSSVADTKIATANIDAIYAVYNLVKKA